MLFLNLGLAHMGSWLSGEFSLHVEVGLEMFFQLKSFQLFTQLFSLLFFFVQKKAFLLVSAISFAYVVYACQQWLHYLKVTMLGPLVNAIVTYV